MMCPYLLISINELLISIISFNDINKYGLNVKTAAHRGAWLSMMTDSSLLYCSHKVCVSPTAVRSGDVARSCANLILLIEQYFLYVICFWTGHGLGSFS